MKPLDRRQVHHGGGKDQVGLRFRQPVQPGDGIAADAPPEASSGELQPFPGDVRMRIHQPVRPACVAVGPVGGHQPDFGFVFVGRYYGHYLPVWCSFLTLCIW